MKWFKHDSNASRDAKLRRLRMKFGMEGYGLYWYCLELIADRVEITNLTFELEHDAEIIAHDTGIHRDRVQDMMTYMIDLGLFEIESGVVTCMKMAMRLDQSMTSNPMFRTAINHLKDQRNNHHQENHDAIMTESDSVMREEKRREEKRNTTSSNKNSVADASRPASSKKFAKPTLEEVTAFCRSRNNSVNPSVFIDHYESNGWKVGKTPMCDWKAAVRTWEQRDNNTGVSNATRQHVDNSAPARVRRAHEERDRQRERQQQRPVGDAERVD